jgi:hypothetical protein
VTQTPSEALDKKRRITANIHTSKPNRSAPDGRPYVLATYKRAQRIENPFDAPVFAIVAPRPGGWASVVHLQAAAHTEAGAIQNLVSSLEELGLGDAECDEACAVSLALMSATEWPLQDMGTRGPKPRAKRHDWRDAVTGKRTLVYADTLKPHRDPACTCAGCTAITTPTQDPEE